MKDSFWIVLILVLGVISATVQNFFVIQEITLLEKKMETAQEKYEEHLDDVYFLMKSDSARLYTIMDTEVRILHYAKPHTHPMWACPECAEQKQRGEENDVQSRDKHGEGEKEAGG